MEEHINLLHGFLPVSDPLFSLPKDFQIWDDLGRDLPKLLLSKFLQNTLEKMPVLDVAMLNRAELERAMLLLSFFGHAYVWGTDKIPAKIPQSIAVPWYEVSKKLGRHPVLSYASYALNNWRRVDISQPIELGNIVLLQNFLGGLDEEWFVLVHIDIEMKASNALQLFVPIQDAIKTDSIEKLPGFFQILIKSLTSMCQTLDRMVERCDPYIYYNRVRPYIHGWKDNPALPQGIVYEGATSFQGKPQQFRGETGAQSSIIPAFDALFGIKHHPDPLRVYLMEMREYMPSPHREFIRHIEKNTSVREYVLKNKDSYPELRESYNDCLRLLSQFRQTHLRYAAQYIQKQSQTSLANPTAIGTGGTPFMEYLRKHKDETLTFLVD